MQRFSINWVLKIRSRMPYLACMMLLPSVWASRHLTVNFSKSYNSYVAMIKSVKTCYRRCSNTYEVLLIIHRNNGVSAFIGQNGTITLPLMMLLESHLIKWFLENLHLICHNTLKASVEAVQVELLNREQILQILKRKLFKAREAMKHYVDKRGLLHPFKVGDLVLLNWDLIDKSQY